MRPFRPLTPIPNGYFPQLRTLIEATGARHVDFDYYPGLKEQNYQFLTFDEHGYNSHSEERFHHSPELFAKLKAVANFAVSLHAVIAEHNPEVVKYERINISARAANIRGWAEGFHIDGTHNSNWLGYLACDTHGTLYRSRLLGRTRRMPTGMINEFYPLTVHAEPVTNSEVPIPRTFVRFTYHPAVQYMD